MNALSPTTCYFSSNEFPLSERHSAPETWSTLHEHNFKSINLCWWQGEPSELLKASEERALPLHRPLFNSNNTQPHANNHHPRENEYANMNREGLQNGRKDDGRWNWEKKKRRMKLVKIDPEFTHTKDQNGKRFKEKARPIISPLFL